MPGRAARRGRLQSVIDFQSGNIAAALGGADLVLPTTCGSGTLEAGEAYDFTTPLPTCSDATLRTRYDFTKAKKNPYARRLKRQITIHLDGPIIASFKSLATDLDIPYQALINLYLRDCAATRRRLALRWNRRPEGSR